MRFFLKVDPNSIPASVNQSYMPFGFYKIGVCAWDYGGYSGEVEWINTLNFCSEPKLQGAVGIKYWVRPELTLLQARLDFSPLPPVSAVQVMDALLNPITGKGFPIPWTT